MTTRIASSASARSSLRQVAGAVGSRAGRGEARRRNASFQARAPFLPRDVLILGASRTPIGSFCGGLADFPAPTLGAHAMSAALRKARVNPDEVEAVVFGHALPAGCGQNAVRQAALGAEMPPVVDCTAVNKACASGLKAVMLAAQAIALGHSELIVAGGMESMSKAPYLLRKARTGGYHYGHGALEDAALLDGLWDASGNCHMGITAERAAEAMGISREEQDAYSIESYRRAASAWQRGAMDAYVSPIKGKYAKRREKKLITCDEEYTRCNIDAIAAMPPVFMEDGTITAASAASLNDGAAALVLCSAERARDLGVDAIARVLSFADHGIEPHQFAVAPAGAVRRALRSAALSSVDFHEVHEAFAVVALAHMRSLDLDPSRLNVNGGAIALGSPLGASGANILCSLLGVLDQQDASTGCAAIANGGGGASAMIVERV
eukprot:TRINITY_DN20521_c0_g1_i2.p1 TRINITY_DN20521_c0_g1~~TRINITY_DN20521_c0_g1_i2.p1  ORF type:complete len:455 (+),score=101.58 TRINITY_DN20521_c0_g1_i2:52-1365(+)